MAINRRENRVQAMQLIYLMELEQLSKEDLIKYAFEKLDFKIEGSYALELVEGVASKRGALEKIISMYLPENWIFERLNKVEQAILLIGAWEILATDTPKQIIINEAVEITKEYSDISSSKYVNALLDKIERRPNK